MAKESVFMEKIEAACKKKQALFDKSKSRYAIRSMFAGGFLTLTTAGGAFAADRIGLLNPELSRFVFPFLFAWGLVYILFLNAELTTSNMMYLGAGTFLRKIKPSKALSILFYCTFFNLIGAVIVALLFSQTSAFAGMNETSFLVNVVSHKIERSSSLILIEGTIANIFVNIAILSYLLIKDANAKLWVIISAIFMFVFLGNDHVAANFASFSLVKFSHLAEYVHQFDVLNILRQWTMAFLGNCIGGGVMIGLAYAFLNKDQEDYVD